MFCLVLINSLIIKSLFLGSAIFRNEMFLLTIFSFFEHDFERVFEHGFEHGFDHGFQVFNTVSIMGLQYGFDQCFKHGFEHGF